MSQTLAEVARTIVTKVAGDTASILHTRNDLGIYEYDREPISEEEFIREAVDLATGEECGCLDPDEAIQESLMKWVEQQLGALLSPRTEGAVQ